tara:strand:+ start:2121 stop:3029 length:909 start_codon:yes stop_codon:yes gene_type:complete
MFKQRKKIDKFCILLPVYNDWPSLKKLLLIIDKKLIFLKGVVTVVVVNDASTTKPNLDTKKFKKIKQIQIINLKKNLGSQKSISIGLKHLKNKNGSIVLVIDSDGEDDVGQVKKMFLTAMKFENHIVVSNRTKRREVFYFKIFYKIHLLITLLLTWKWISFGNFTSFHTKHIKKLNFNDAWLAFPAALIKSFKLKNLYAERKNRYFGRSKVSFLKLFFHSFSIISVFYKKIFFNSVLYCVFFYFISKFLENNYFIFLFSGLIFLNIALLTYRLFFKIKNKPTGKQFIKNIMIINNKRTIKNN